ncbi:MAG TPA: hypothetical protein VJ579_01550 [Candidatus Paceibacterota bacterium]|nr:hypothetical protein [Candidatus Paceibacterota bacterium]
MQKRTYITLIVAALLAVILGGIVWYGIDAITTLKGESDTARGEFQSWIRKSKQVLSLRKTLDRAVAVDASLQEFSFTVTDENQIQLISDLERIGRVTGVKAEVRDLEVAADSSSIAGSLSFIGEWKNVYHAIAALEVYPFKLFISDITISEDSPSQSGGVSRVNYRANVRFTLLHTHKP